MGAYINGDYKSEYSGDQIDAAIGKVRTPDSTPTASSDNLVTSGGVKTALDTKQAVIDDLATIRSNATDGKAAYDKIDEGLAKGDLDAGVQASLDKADAAAPQSTTYTKTQVDNALATKAAKNGSGSEDFNAKSVILPTTGSGTGTSQILGANSPVPGRYFLPDSASGGQGYTLATTDMVNQKADKDTDAVEGNIAEFDANGNPVDSGVPTTKIGEIEEGLSVLRNSAGIAEGIADTISAGTPQEFVFRQSGGDGVNYMKRIKGKSLVWNQLVQNGNFASTDGWSATRGTISAISNKCVYTISIVSSNPNDNRVRTTFNSVSGHKYYAHYTILSKVSGSRAHFRLENSENESALISFVANTKTLVSGIMTASITGSDGLWLCLDQGNAQVNDTVEISNVVLIDLTLMFGSGNEPSTVAEFEAMFPEAYYPYNPGSLESNDAAALLTEGRNQWDEEWENGRINVYSGENTSYNGIRSKNYISAIAGKTYYFKKRAGDTSAYVIFYDGNNGYIGYHDATSILQFSIPSGASFMRFVIPTDGAVTTYNNDICINLSDASFNGQYEPYWKRRIELNLSTLKDVDGNLVFPYGGMHGTGTAFDSMKPEADGFIHYANRVFARVNLGDLTWTADPSYSSGVYRMKCTALRGIIKNNTSAERVPNYIICSKYSAITPNNTYGYPSFVGNGITVEVDGSVTLYDGAHNSQSSAPSPSDNWLAGVYLVYEVETPAVVELAEPIPNAILVDSYGTEHAIFPTHEDGSPSAPFACDSNYSISVKNLVAKLNSLNG